MSEKLGTPRVLGSKLGMSKLKHLNKVCWWLPASGHEVTNCTLIQGLNSRR